MKRRTKLIFAFLLLASSTAVAVTNFKNALQFGNGSTSWTSATGSSSGHGVYWSSTSGQLVMHPEGGPDVVWGTSGGGGGGGSSVPQVNVDFADWVSSNGGALSAGNFSTGMEFYVTQAATLTGVKVWWTGTATLTATLWSGAGASLATGTLGVSGAAAVRTITVAHALNAYTMYFVTVYDGGTNFASTATTTGLPTMPFTDGPSLVAVDRGYNAGNAAPNTFVTTVYPAMPVFTVP